MSRILKGLSLLQCKDAAAHCRSAAPPFAPTQRICGITAISYVKPKHWPSRGACQTGCMGLAQQAWSHLTTPLRATPAGWARCEQAALCGENCHCSWAMPSQALHCHSSTVRPVHMRQVPDLCWELCRWSCCALAMSTHQHIAGLCSCRGALAFLLQAMPTQRAGVMLDMHPDDSTEATSVTLSCSQVDGVKVHGLHHALGSTVFHTARTTCA